MRTGLCQRPCTSCTYVRVEQEGMNMKCGCTAVGAACPTAYGTRSHTATIHIPYPHILLVPYTVGFWRGV